MFSLNKMKSKKIFRIQTFETWVTKLKDLCESVLSIRKISKTNVEDIQKVTVLKIRMLTKCTYRTLCKLMYLNPPNNTKTSALCPQYNIQVKYNNVSNKPLSDNYIH